MTEIDDSRAVFIDSSVRHGPLDSAAEARSNKRTRNSRSGYSRCWERKAMAYFAT